MRDNEIRHKILAVCKVQSWDSDINVTAFHSLCDQLKQLGVEAEREACAKVCDEFWLNGRYLTDVADSIRARGTNANSV